MSYLFALLLLSANAAPAVPPAAPAMLQDDAEKGREAKVVEAIARMKSNDPAATMALLDPVLADYEKLHPAADGRTFCASDPTAALGALLAAAAAKAPEKVSTISSTWCFALWAKGFALVEQNELEAALPYLVRASAMMPERAQFAAELGYVHQQLKHWQLSIDAYREAERGARAMPEGDSRKFELRRALFGIGYNLIELGQLDQAEATFKAALEVAPADQKILNELQYIKDQRAKAGPTA